MKQLRPNEGLRIFDIKWEVTTAGPSPNANKRIEVFLLGCNKAISGNPCKGCFNSPLWNPNIATISRDPIEVANLLNDKCENNKYVTIGGGEPLDQLDNLWRSNPSAFGFNHDTLDIYGNHPSQSPLWIRPQALFSDMIEEYSQVVGHTQFKEPKYEYPNHYTDDVIIFTDTDKKNGYVII